MSIRVVIAEDHVLVREGTRRLLEQVGAVEVVGEAGDGESAVRLVQEHQPDIALMDIAMPGLNGVEATRAIKGSCPKTAVLVLTAFDDDEYIFALLEAGAAGYLLKTVSSDELIAAVRAIHAGESVLSPTVAARVLARLVSVPAVFGPANPRENQLTPREREVLLLAARGLANKAIAGELDLSPRTVQMHLASIFEKLSVASRTEAVVTALRRGWLPIEDL